MPGRGDHGQGKWRPEPEQPGQSEPEQGHRQRGRRGVGAKKRGSRPVCRSGRSRGGRGSSRRPFVRPVPPNPARREHREPGRAAPRWPRLRPVRQGKKWGTPSGRNREGGCGGGGRGRGRRGTVASNSAASQRAGGAGESAHPPDFRRPQLGAPGQTASDCRNTEGARRDRKPLTPTATEPWADGGGRGWSRLLPAGGGGARAPTPKEERRSPTRPGGRRKSPRPARGYRKPQK